MFANAHGERDLSKLESMGTLNALVRCIEHDRPEETAVAKDIRVARWLFRRPVRRFVNEGRLVAVPSISGH